MQPHVSASWRSLFRTTRAPISILAIAALSLGLPSQTGDELAALREMYVGPLSGLVILQLSLGFLSLNAWYWARAALSPVSASTNPSRPAPACNAAAVPPSMPCRA